MSDLDGCLLARFAGRQPPDWLRRWLDDGLGGSGRLAVGPAGKISGDAAGTESDSQNDNAGDVHTRVLLLRKKLLNEAETSASVITKR